MPALPGATRNGRSAGAAESADAAAAAALRVKWPFLAALPPQSEAFLAPENP